MKVSSILAISVIIKLQQRQVFRYIFSPNTKVSSILAVNVIIKQEERRVSDFISSISTRERNGETVL